MAFTDEDRNILIETKTKVDNIERWMSNLPCQQHPPECTQENRIGSLETSRRRWYTGIVATAVGAIVAGVGALIRSLMN